MASNSRKYVPPHLRRRSNNPRTPPKPAIKAFFGDSFVRLFGLIERRDLLVRGFKGGSAKGLGREGNENRDAILRFVQNNRNVERLVFSFGSVDVHLSYYYKKYVLKGEDIDLDDIAERYVDFIASLPVEASVVRTVIGVYPSPLADADVGPSLASYGSLSEEQAAEVSASDDAKLQRRQERVQYFNDAIAKRCQERGVEYADVNEDMLNGDTNEIRDAYRDVSDHNIHVVWETTLLLWLDKWPWLRELAPPGFEEQLQRTLEEYLKTKPWAERSHVAENVGVQGAVRKASVTSSHSSESSPHAKG